MTGKDIGRRALGLREQRAHGDLATVPIIADRPPVAGPAPRERFAWRYLCAALHCSHERWSGTQYRDTSVRHLSDDEVLRSLAATDRLETAWYEDPAHVGDLRRLSFHPRVGMRTVRFVSAPPEFMRDDVAIPVRGIRVRRAKALFIPCDPHLLGVAVSAGVERGPEGASNFTVS